MCDPVCCEEWKTEELDEAFQGLLLRGHRVREGVGVRVRAYLSPDLCGLVSRSAS